MGRLIRWQAIIAFSGIALIGAFLFSVAVSRTTILVPDEGGTYVEGLAGTPQHINPLLAQYNQVDQDLVALIFNGLTRRSSLDEPEPDLAARWTMSPDGITYLFWLREDVRWSDGERFDADDVIFTVNLMQDPDFPGVPYLGDLWRTVTVEKIDDFSVRFRLSEPFPPFLDYTSIGILPEHLLSGVPAKDLATHPFNSQPVGTGPFMLTEISVKQATLVSNPRYFGKIQPYVDAIQFRFYPTYEQLLTAYQSGEIMGISYVPPYLFPEAAGLESLDLYSARLSGYQIVYLNLQDEEHSPFFEDVLVRQALLYGLDRQALIDQSLNGQGLVANGPMRPWIWAYDPDVPHYDYDLARAQSLLDQAGWVDSDGDGVRDREGNMLQFSLLTSDDPIFTGLARGMADQWARLGVAVTVEPLESGLGERLRDHDFQAVLVEILLTGDPDPYPMWHQTQIEGGQNFGGWNNEPASQALEQARKILDQDQRRELYIEFQRIFAQELPALVIAHPVYTYAVDQSVRQVQIGPLLSPSDRFRNIADWYMNTRRVVVTEADHLGVTPVPSPEP
jgi:peptide/nickel transport system substrate-binding protein